MGKIKVKKQSTFIDMTAMSDVTVLLLTFFMFTSTFRAIEPIQVIAPASVSDFPIPETNLVTILFDTNGKIFMSFTNDQDKVDALTAVGEDYGITFTSEQVRSFRAMKSFGLPVRSLASFLDLSETLQQKQMEELDNPRVGIPRGESSDERGSIAMDNEFLRWISHATANNSSLTIAIKADQNTNYPVVKGVIDDLRSIRKNKYLLITSLRTASH